MPITGITVTAILPAVVIGTTIKISKHANGLAAKVLSIELLDGTFGVLAGLVLQGTFAGVVAVYVSESNTPRLATEILEILWFGKHCIKIKPSWVGVRKPIRIPTARTTVPSPKRAEIIGSRVKLL